MIRALVVQRYLYREILGTLAGVLAVLLLIFTSKHFVRYLSDAAAGLLPTSLILEILVYFILSSLVYMLPFALYISVLLALGRMYQDNEVTAMEACGIGLPEILRGVVGFAAVFSLSVAVLSLWIAPVAEQQQLRIRSQAESESEFGLIAAGRFHPILEGRGVFYAEEVSDDRRVMRNVFVQVQGGEKLDVFSAETGSMTLDRNTGDQYVILHDGYRYEWLPGGQGYRIHQYETSGVRIFRRDADTESASRGAKPTIALLQSDNSADAAELQWRISMPLSAVLLAILGGLLSRTSPRQGRFAKLLMALLAYAVYFNLMTVSQSWLKKGFIPEFVGMWWVHLAMAALVAALLTRRFRVRPRPAAVS